MVLIQGGSVTDQTAPGPREKRTHQVRAMFPMAGRLWLRETEPEPEPGQTRGRSFKYSPLRSEAGAWDISAAEYLAREVERREAGIPARQVEIVPVGSDWPHPG